MKIEQLLTGLKIMLTNQEHDFVTKHKNEISLSSLSENDLWMAQNLVRKGIYSISNNSKTLIKKLDEYKSY